MLKILKTWLSTKNANSGLKARIGSPKTPVEGLLRSRSLGAGDPRDWLSHKIDPMPALHRLAVTQAGLSALRATEGRKEPKWSKVHLVRLTYARGTSLAVASKKLPLGVRGSLLGAAVPFHGSSGHLHVYAFVRLR